MFLRGTTTGIIFGIVLVSINASAFAPTKPAKTNFLHNNLFEEFFEGGAQHFVTQVHQLVEDKESEFLPFASETEELPTEESWAGCVRNYVHSIPKVGADVATHFGDFVWSMRSFVKMELARRDVDLRIIRYPDGSTEELILKNGSPLPKEVSQKILETIGNRIEPRALTALNKTAKKVVRSLESTFAPYMECLVDSSDAEDLIRAFREHSIERSGGLILNSDGVEAGEQPITTELIPMRFRLEFLSNGEEHILRKLLGDLGFKKLMNDNGLNEDGTPINSTPVVFEVIGGSWSIGDWGSPDEDSQKQQLIKHFKKESPLLSSVFLKEL